MCPKDLHTPGVSWSPYLAPLGPPCSFLRTPLGLPGRSPSRGFRMFTTFTSFYMFSSHITIFFKHESIWVPGGAQVAIQRGPAHPGPLPFGFSVFPQISEIWIYLTKTPFLKIHMDRVLLECLPELPGALFWIFEISENTLFRKRGLIWNKYGVSLLPIDLG